MTRLIEVAYPALALHEEQGAPLRVSGIASETNKPNGNNRVYPREIMAREVARVAERLSQSDHVGTVDHPDWAPSVSDLGLKFTNLWMEGDLVKFEAEVIPTQKGKDLEAVIRAGVRVGISSRGTGSSKRATWEGREVSLIQGDYTLESYDAVVTPSVAGARVTNYEGLIESLRRDEPEAYGALLRLLREASEHIAGEEVPEEQRNVIQSEDAPSPNGEIMAEEHLPSAAEEPVEETAPVGDAVVEETILDEDVDIDPIAYSVEEDAPAVAEAAVEPEEEPVVVEASVEDALGIPVRTFEERIAQLEAELAEERARRTDEDRGHQDHLTEDANLRAALVSLVNAINDHVGQGHYDLVASIAGCASSVDFLDKYMAGGSYEALKAGKGPALADAILAPLGALAARVERDRVAVERTSGVRYGRRLLDLLLAECATVDAIDASFDELHARVHREATGTSLLPEIKGRLRSEEERPLTDEQLRQRQLAGLR